MCGKSTPCKGKDFTKSSRKQMKTLDWEFQLRLDLVDIRHFLAQHNHHSAVPCGAGLPWEVRTQWGFSVTFSLTSALSQSRDWWICAPAATRTPKPQEGLVQHHTLSPGSDRKDSWSPMAPIPDQATLQTICGEWGWLTPAELPSSSTTPSPNYHKSPLPL